MELLWHNGQVVMQSQNQRSKKPDTREIEPTRPSDHLFMHEDEMASWLHYPLDDNPLENYVYGTGTGTGTGTDLIPSTAAPTSLPPPHQIPSRPPVPPYRRVEVKTNNTNFGHFTRLGSSKFASETRASRVSEKPAAVGLGCAASTSSAMREMETCEMSVTSSGGSEASASMEPLSEKPAPVSDDRKRKGVDADDNEGHTEDVEFDYADGKKQSHAGSTYTKRSRAAEVHNLSERRRRDRINEKMKALQELIPRCNKSDKASMLDEAIEYLKSLQMQVQMMSSMGCNMVPMMFLGVQQCVPPMAMGMGMGMGMDMGMNHGMVPYPAILPGSSLPNPAAAAHLGQRFPVPGFNMSPVTIAGPTTNQGNNMSDQMRNALNLDSQNQARVPNFAGPFQHYLGLHQTQLPFPQNQGGVPPNATTPNSNRYATNPDHKQTG